MKKAARPTIVIGTIVIAVAAIMFSNALGQRPTRGFRPGQGDAQLQKDPVPKDDNEKMILGILDDIRARQSYRNVPPQDGRLLRMLAETMRAKNVVEIGTSTGYSAIWFGMALQKTGGKLVTYEIDERRASLARENFKQAGVEEQVTLVMGDAHETVKKFDGMIDILFLDADKEGYIDYLEKLLPKIRPGGLILAHNITPRQSDPRYIEAITKNPALESLLVHGQVSLTMKKR